MLTRFIDLLYVPDERRHRPQPSSACRVSHKTARRIYPRGSPTWSCKHHSTFFLVSVRIMLWSSVCASYVLLLIHRFLCDAATIPAGDGSLIDTPAPLINFSLPAVAPPATPSLNDIQIQCQGPMYGTDLNYASCLDTFGTFEHGRDPTPIRIGRRYAGPYVRYLPWRWVGGTYSRPISFQANRC